MYYEDSHREGMALEGLTQVFEHGKGLRSQSIRSIIVIFFFNGLCRAPGWLSQGSV